jgi:hypothetical protein
MRVRTHVQQNLCSVRNKHSILKKSLFQYYFQIHKLFNFLYSNTIKRIKLSFKTYLKFSALKTIGGIMFYLGFAVIAVGIVFGLLSRLMAQVLPFMIVFVVAGVVLSVSGYMIHSYGKFRENAEQIARGVSTGIQNVPNASNTIPPPPSNLCPSCRHPLTYIEQYIAWYCFNCKEYK